jgi:hypothetical protein
LIDSWSYREVDPVTEEQWLAEGSAVASTKSELISFLLSIKEYGRSAVARGREPARIAAKEDPMIELTEQQRQAVQEHQGGPVQVTDPVTQETFVLVRRELYERLMEFDDSPWMDEEMDRLAEEAGEMLDSFGKQP